MQLFKPKPFSVNLPSRNSKSKGKALPTGTLQLDGKVRKRINWVLNSCNCIVMEHDLERASTPGCQLVWNCEFRLAQGNLFTLGKKTSWAILHGTLYKPSETASPLSQDMRVFHFMLPLFSDAIDVESNKHHHKAP